MILRSGVYALEGGVSAADESESLQTDVMRFMAILGLCLMVIFALVQSIPTSGVTREQMRAQEQERYAMDVEIMELREQTASIRSALEVESVLRQSLELEYQEQSKQLRDLQQRLSARDTEALALAESVERMSQQLQSERDAAIVEINRLMASLDAERESVRQAEQMLESEQRSRVQPASENTRPESNAGQDAPLVAEPSETGKPDAGRLPQQGFTLKFASNAAFLKLLATGRIEVYASVDTVGFKLSVDGKRVAKSPLPGKFQEVNAQSLPESVLSSVRGAGMDTRKAQWRVVLSKGTLASIDRARAGATGGTLLIEENGQVSLSD